MKRVSCVAIISIVIAMSGCAVDSMEDQEEEPEVGTIESAAYGDVRLDRAPYAGGWLWVITNNSSGWAYRRVAFYPNGVGDCHGIAPWGGQFQNWSAAYPWYLVGC